MARVVPISDAQKFNQSQWGAQDRIVIAAVPAGAAGSLVSKALVDVGALTVAGVYECLVPISGFRSTVEVHLTATFAAGTVTSALNTLFYVSNAALPSTWTNKTAGSGAGAMTTTTRQTSSFATAALRGEQYARVTLTLAGTSSVTFTQAEYNGL